MSAVRDRLRPTRIRSAVEVHGDTLGVYARLLAEAVPASEAYAIASTLAWAREHGLAVRTTTDAESSFDALHEARRAHGGGRLPRDVGDACTRYTYAVVDTALEDWLEIDDPDEPCPVANSELILAALGGMEEAFNQYDHPQHVSVYTWQTCAALLEEARTALREAGDPRADQRPAARPARSTQSPAAARPADRTLTGAPA